VACRYNIRFIPRSETSDLVAVLSAYLNVVASADTHSLSVITMIIAAKRADKYIFIILCEIKHVGGSGTPP
jgi:hypothetical protein